MTEIAFKIELLFGGRVCAALETITAMACNEGEISPPLAMLNHDIILNHIDDLFGQNMHAKGVLSLANATHWVIECGSVALQAISNGLSLASGLARKYTVKQVDHVLTNTKPNVWCCFDDWVPFMVAKGGQTHRDPSIHGLADADRPESRAN